MCLASKRWIRGTSKIKDLLICHSSTYSWEVPPFPSKNVQFFKHSSCCPSFPQQKQAMLPLVVPGSRTKWHFPELDIWQRSSAFQLRQIGTWRRLDDEGSWTDGGGRWMKVTEEKLPPLKWKWKKHVQAKSSYIDTLQGESGKHISSESGKSNTFKVTVVKVASFEVTVVREFSRCLCSTFQAESAEVTLWGIPPTTILMLGQVNLEKWSLGVCGMYWRNDVGRCREGKDPTWSNDSKLRMTPNRTFNKLQYRFSMFMSIFFLELSHISCLTSKKGWLAYGFAHVPPRNYFPKMRFLA